MREEHEAEIGSLLVVVNALGAAPHASATGWAQLKPHAGTEREQ